ncbi:MAG TPA: FAD-dependent oxidoreductase [Candidatus Saccharimonadia bacterium]|nr:FAD-dependent oxidoreductase [Candidatus Saccharimonadia bacterium]
MTDAKPKTNVVVVGGGFGGVRAARGLARQPGVSVTLISSHTHFAYYPQLYHAATGGVRSEAALRLGELLAGVPVRLVHDTATTFDPEARTVTTASGTVYPYDELVLALGSVTNYFGIEGLQEFSYDIKTIDGAERFKRHLHDQLIAEQRPELHYVIVGGGPTGIELAAALSQYVGQIVAQHGVRRPKYQVDLVEGAPRLLPRLPEAFARRIQRQLERLGVRVMTGAVVEAETAETLRLKGQSITSHTVVWTAGVSNNPFFADNAAHFNLAKNHRVEVNEQLEARPHVYVIGDNANTQYAGLAQTALDNADFVVADVARKRRRVARSAYRPKAPITVIPVGTGWAAVQWGGLQLFGYVGWILRRLADLVGYADVESWPRALGVWLRDGRHEDQCAICDHT